MGFSFRLQLCLRSYHWRGFDCADSRIQKTDHIYPGRSAEHNNWDSNKDSNCNGIYGKNETATFEEVYCKEYPGTGIVNLGDSATAHFHLPRKIFMGGEWNQDTFADLLTLAKNEGDWPMLSWGTGYEDVYPKYSRDFTNLDSWPKTRSLYR